MIITPELSGEHAHVSYQTSSEAQALSDRVVTYEIYGNRNKIKKVQVEGKFPHLTQCGHYVESYRRLVQKNSAC
jgi:hypothetical protein